MEFTFSNVNLCFDNEAYVKPDSSQSMLGRTWNLRLYPNGRKTKNEGRTELYLQLNDSDSAPIYAGYTFTVINQNGGDDGEHKTCHSGRRNRLFQNGGRSVGVNKIMPFELLSDPSKGFCVNGKVLVVVTLQIVSSMRSHSSTNDLSTLSHAADCNIIVNGVHIHAHKWVLGEHSEMFKMMFESEMTEGITNTVTISDFSEQTVRSLLRCVYDSSAIDSELPHRALELFAITSMYAFDILHRQSARYLILHTCVTNACDMLKLAHLYEHAILKQTAMKVLAQEATTDRKTRCIVVDLGTALMIEFIRYLAAEVRGGDALAVDETDVEMELAGEDEEEEEE